MFHILIQGLYFNARSITGSYFGVIPIRLLSISSTPTSSTPTSSTPISSTLISSTHIFYKIINLIQNVSYFLGNVSK